MDLYRFFDCHNRLLYVGISVHAAIRLLDHRATKSWWLEVERVQIEHHDVVDRFEMLVIESDAIRSERPLYNVMGNNRDRQDHVMPSDQNEWFVAVATTRLRSQFPRQWVFTVRQVAELCDLSTDDIYNQIKRGDIKNFRIGGGDRRMIRIGPDEVVRLMLVAARQRVAAS